MDRSGRDKRQRAPLEGDRMAIPIGFYIGARPEPAVVHLPSSVVGCQKPLLVDYLAMTPRVVYRNLHFYWIQSL